MPFVDEKRLFKALAPRRNKLSEEECKYRLICFFKVLDFSLQFSLYHVFLIGRRNTTGEERLYIGPESSAYKLVSTYYKENMDCNTEIPILIDGMKGTILLTKENVEIDGTLDSPVMGLHPITENTVITIYYRNPAYDAEYIFPARKLEGAKMPERVLKGKDNNNPNYRPTIGFNNQRQQSVQITGGGHRMLNHYTNNYNSDNRSQGEGYGGAYSNVAPPTQSRKFLKCIHLHKTIK